MSDEPFTTPVALIAFNRPDNTKRVLDAIASIRPTRLFLIADGPRVAHPTDGERCKSTRAVLRNVTWPCDVRIDFADRNKGCRERTISGTDWVFSQVDEAIFLEDDTVPDPSFFRFCKELLQKYRHDSRVMSIGGVCHRSQPSSAYSYFFSAFPNTWGRAMWRRSWERFDPKMTLWHEIRDGGWLSNIFPNRAQARYWHRMMEATYRGRFDSWGYPFTFSCLVQSGLSIVPGRNLVRNIGVGRDSTNTKVEEGGLAELMAGSMEFPLRHPPMVLRDRAYDDLLHEKFFHSKHLLERARSKIRRLMDEYGR